MHTTTLQAPSETVVLPKIYRAMCEDGLLDYRHPNGIRLSDTHWLASKSIESYASAEEETPTLLPFARNQQGDAWCWYKGWEINGAVPVVFVSRHADDVMGYAPDFAGCIYRMLLEEMAACHLVGQVVETPDELPALFQWYAQNVQRYMPSGWRYTLQSLNLANRPVIDVGHNAYAVLFQDQVEEMITRDLGFSALNQEVKIAVGF